MPRKRVAERRDPGGAAANQAGHAPARGTPPSSSLSPFTAPPPRLRHALGPPVLIAVLVFACFLPVLGNDFVNLDDQYYFTENLRYRGLSLTHLHWMFTTFQRGQYQPLSWLSHGVVYTIWGMNPTAYHLGNLLLHAANSVLVYILIAGLLRPAWREGERGHPLAMPVAATVGALVFAIHPLRVEAVAWASERHRVLCAFFLLLTVLGYLRMCAAQRAGLSSGLAWFVLSVSCYALSLLAEATGVTLPVILLALDFYPLARFRHASATRAWVALLVEKVPYAIFACAAAAVALLAEHPLTIDTPAERGMVARGLQAAYALCFYLWKTVVPIGLLPLYPLQSTPGITESRYILPVVAVVGMTTVLILLSRRYPWALTAWTCYVVIVSPNLGFVPGGPQIAADRYTYLSCLPWAVLAAAALYRLWTGVEQRRIAWPTAGVAAAAIVMILALLGVRTVQQTRIWKNSFALWDHVLQTDPSALAYNNRGYERYVKGDLAGALADFDNALRLEPQYIAAHYYRGKVRETQGDADEAMAEFNAALRLKPELGEAYAGRATARQAKGDVEGALADFDHALRLAPDDTQAAISRGNLRQTRGDAQGALADFTHVITIAPGRVEAYYNRGNLLKQMGDLNGALADYNATLRLNPQHASAFNNRGNLRTKMGDLDGALADYTEVIRLNPQHASGYNNRGNLRRTQGDLDGALADYTQAVHLAPPDAPQRATFERNLATTRQQLAARQQGNGQ